MSLPCPLCNSLETEFYHQDKKRQYQQCQHCELVFVPTQFHLCAEEEKAEYDKHENSIEDEGYLRFLSRMADPIDEHVAANCHGIDIGCGEAPALAKLLQNKGHDVALYDLYYHPDKDVLNAQYDFVTCTEVIEHIAKPSEFLSMLFSLLKSNGTLGLMTKLVIDNARFSNWHYKNDPTHICFYSEKTFEFILQSYCPKEWNTTLEFIGNDVIMFRRCSKN